MLSSFATQEKECLKRYYDEHNKKQLDFETDRARLIHSNSFRKLGYKTQIFLNYAGDLYRTRLTHSIEVAQVTRNIAKQLGLNVTLAEIIALAHDLGHSPFGHSGERALQSIAAEFEPFNHNTQTVRILTYLEKLSPHFPGLNLSITTLDGILKHNGPIINTIPASILHFAEQYEIDLSTFPSLEAQVAAIADDIAYTVHDIDDGIRANLITVDDITNNVELPFKYDNLDASLFLNKLLDIFIEDVVITSTLKLKHITYHDDLRTVQTILFSDEIQKIILSIKYILMKKVYKHYTITKISFTTEKIIVDLFNAFFNNPDCLPTEWYDLIKTCNKKVEKYKIVCDYISGMTDRFAIYQHQKLFNINYSLGYY